uniref:Uncharacterized protein n=2 Tax=Ixodes scapularis TaxID=6945 RepID=A0A1S4KNQ4_IXOSC
ANERAGAFTPSSLTSAYYLGSLFRFSTPLAPSPGSKGSGPTFPRPTLGETKWNGHPPLDPLPFVSTFQHMERSFSPVSSPSLPSS